mgnify:CR=1 FL=1
MADLPFFVEINEQNLTETLQRSVETPLVINFYAPSHKESVDFAKCLTTCCRTAQMDNLSSA